MERAIATTPSHPAGRLRHPGDALPRSSIGAVPILWSNADRLGGHGPFSATTILDEIAQAGFEGTQLGTGFPAGETLRDELRRRGLRLAEAYAPLPATVDGPTADAEAIAVERLRLLHAAGGEMLCLALDSSVGRAEAAGQVAAVDAPTLTDAGWARLVGVVHAIADRAISLGHPVSFHPHAGTFIETPPEVDRLVALTDPRRLGLCLDVGHHIVGGGDPVAALRELGDRVSHVHLKDVDPGVLARLRSGALTDLAHATDERLFTELGAGVLDLDGVIAELSGRDYAGWLMVEQDSSWRPPSESAAIGRRVLAEALGRHGRDRAHQVEA